MAHLLTKTHFVDKHTLARLNAAILLGLVGTSLAVCVAGAVIFDFGRLLFLW